MTKPITLAEARRETFMFRAVWHSTLNPGKVLWKDYSTLVAAKACHPGDLICRIRLERVK